MKIITLNFRCLYSESRGFKNREKKFLGFFHCPSDIGVYGGVMKKAKNCWRVSCSNIYKVYSAKCLKKTRLIYECPSTFALTSDSHEVLYLYWIKIESKTSIVLRIFGYTSGSSKIFTIFALYNGLLSNISIAKDKLDSFEILVLSNTQRNDY